MNNTGSDHGGSDHHGPDRKVRLLLALLVVLGGTLAFLSTSYSEQKFGIQLSSLFSSADEEYIPCAGANCGANLGDPVYCEPGKGDCGAVFNCVTAPCPNPDLAIVNPAPNSKLEVGNKYTISWNGIPTADISRIRPSTFTLKLRLIGQDCNNTRVCYDDYTIIENQTDVGSYVWTVPSNLPSPYLDSTVMLTLIIDNQHLATTPIVIVRNGGGTVDEYPDGTFIRLLSNPNLVYQLNDGTKRQLPNPAEEVIRCLGGDPAFIKKGLPAHERTPLTDPLFCNPASSVASKNGSLISGLPDSDVTSIYLVENGKRRPFPKIEIFNCLGYSASNVHIANSADIKLPIGAPMTCDSNPAKITLLGDGTLPSGVVNQTYSTKFSARGGELPYTYSIMGISGSASEPAVLGFGPSAGFKDAKIDNSGQFSFIPTRADVFQISIKVEDSSGFVRAGVKDGPGQIDYKTYKVQIKDSATTPPNPTAQNCVDGPIQSLVALHRFYNAKDSDHYYSTNATAPRGYVSEGITAYIYPTPVSGTVALYQSYNPERRDHYYTTDQAGAQTYGYKLDGKIGYVYPTQVTGSSPLYRMYNDSAKHYLMTASTIERDAINGLGFVQQGTIGYTCGTSRPGADVIPVYRLWSSKLTDHFYTTDVSERDEALKRGYVSEGIAGNMFSVPGSDRVAVQRLWSAKYGDHFYTTSESEAKASGFFREGVIGFIKVSPSSNVMQFYRLNNSKIGDHFYTTSTSERDAVLKNGYTFEGVMGYLP